MAGSKKGRKLNLTDAERRRRSELAKQLNAERRLGGAEFGRLGAQATNTQRKKRTSTYVRERAQANPRRIWRALSSGLDSDDPDTQRKSAEAILKIEREDEALTLAEQAAYERMHQNELIEVIVQRLERAGAAGQLAKALPMLEA